MLTRSRVLQLKAGQTYRVRIEFHQGVNNPSGRIVFGWRAPGSMESSLDIAKRADHILLALGITPGLEGEEMKNMTAEGFNHGDRVSILLPKCQRDLIDQVAALGKPFVVVLTNGSALSFDIGKPNAILEAWYYGQRGGDAVAEALVGETNPAGRLPVTFYNSEKDLPPFDDYSMANRTYRYFAGKPLFAFGHGLSYNTYQYGKPELSVASAPPGETVSLNIPVTNTGKRSGDEVVQIYARAVKPPVPMPLQTLVGFQRVHFQPGETITVTIPVKVDSLRRWDEKAGRYVVDPGVYELRTGPASDRILGQNILEIP
jgi:beta-glucosidase